MRALPLGSWASKSWGQNCHCQDKYINFFIVFFILFLHFLLCTNVLHLITAPKGQVIRLDFRNSFNIEAKEECKFDFLEVSKGQLAGKTQNTTKQNKKEKKESKYLKTKTKKRSQSIKNEQLCCKKWRSETKTCSVSTGLSWQSFRFVSLTTFPC